MIPLKHGVAALLITAVAAPVVAQQGTAMPLVTLTEARRMAASVDPDAVAARARVASTSWEQRAATIDLFLPQLTANANYLSLSDPFFNFGTGNVSSTATSATLEASYTFLGTGKFSELKRSRAAVASAEANETAIRFRTDLATDAAYYSVLAETELSRVAADRLQRATEQLGIARVRVQAGETIATDSLQLLLEVNRAQMEVLRRDSALTVGRLRLGRLIGHPGPATAAPLDSAVPPPLPIDLESAVAELRTRGPEIELARAQERSAAAVLLQRRERFLPDITLSGVTGAYDSEFFPSALHRSQFQVALSWPLWNGGRREVDVAVARAERDIARAELADLELATAEVMARAWNGYATARAAVELAQVGVAVSTETFRVQGARYREGASTILDLLEAQVSLGEAEAALVQARHGARLALAEIEALLGRRIFEAPN